MSAKIARFPGLDKLPPPPAVIWGGQVSAWQQMTRDLATLATKCPFYLAILAQVVRELVKAMPDE